MKRLLLFLVVLTSLLFFTSQSTKAHVFVTDHTKKEGAILHIIPDDDPIAGKTASLFFDVQEGLLHKQSKVSLLISQDNNNKSAYPTTKINGSLITADYTFPHQGVYRIRYTISSSIKSSYTFRQTIRVSRGVVANNITTPVKYTWAEGLLIGSGSILLCIGILAWNRRKDIVRQSQF